MSQVITFAIIGMSIGSVYALLSCGVVLTYQGTGIINFAAAAMATIPLYVYDELTKGKLTLPVPWLASIDVGDVPTWVSVTGAVLVGGCLGALMHYGVSRPLRSAPVLGKVVAAVGVMLTLQAAAGLKYGTDPRPRKALLPTGRLKIGSSQVPLDRVWLILLVVVLAGALTLWFRYSRAGLSIQAAAENERAASLARLSPSALGLITWVLATMFVSFGIVMAGPATGVITTSNLTLLVVPALAGALIARLQSLGMALVGSLLLGVVQSELQYFSATLDWWPGWAQQGLTDAVPFVVITVALFVLGRGIPQRGDDTRSGLPPVMIPRNRPLTLAIMFGGTLAAIILTSGSFRFGMISSLSAALIGLSFVILTGMVGQISLAQAAFAGIGALALSKFAGDLPFPLSLLVAGLTAMVAGIVVGLPALRIRGVQLAVVTLAAAVALEKFVFANASILDPTADLIDDPSLFGWDLGVRGGSNIARIEFAVLSLVIVFGCFVVAGNIMRSGAGRQMLAVRSNERAASSLGISVAGVKLSAFAGASFLAGIGGGLIGYSRGQMSALSFGVFIGLAWMATSYLGGITSLHGAVWAGALAVLGINFVIIDRWLNLGGYYSLFSGIAVILTVLVNPVGIAGKLEHDIGLLVAFIRRKVRGSRSETEAESSADEPGTEVSLVNSEEVFREIGDVVLDIRGMTVRYGGVLAVDDVSLTVRQGEIVGLIGPNGAGKTSTIDGIVGFYPCEGEVRLDGEPLDRLSAYRRARRGLVRTWQSVELFDDLDVAGNVRVGTDAGRGTMGVAIDSIYPGRAAPTVVNDAMSLVGITDVEDRMPSELSLGRQKSLGVARAVAMQPKTILLDEPAAGLDTSESLAFGGQLRRIASQGIGCLLVDHDMHLVFDVCDRVYVLEFGRIIAEGTPAEISRNPRVIEAYLGSDIEEHPVEPVAAQPSSEGRP